jgi:predicted hydrocarbon binding protein
VKLVLSNASELAETLNTKREAVEKVHDRLMTQLLGYLLEDRPLPSRPTLGSDVHLKVAFQTLHQAHRAGERSQMAMRMGGTRTGQALGVGLLEAGLSPDEAMGRVIAFMNDIKVGQASVSAANIKIEENVEALAIKSFAYGATPSCHFTTGFLNGLLSTVRNQHVRESKCLVAGDSICEWQII